MLLASAGGSPVPVIAHLVQADEDTVRDVIHRFDEIGLACYVILDNLSAHLNRKIRRWAAKNKVELCFTPTCASWANLIEAHFGPLRQSTLANSNHPNHAVQTCALHAYLHAGATRPPAHPDVLAAQRRERARLRSERGIRWGGRPLRAAA